MQQHNATNLEKNINLQNDMINLLKQASNWFADIANDEIGMIIEKIWAYNYNDNGSSQHGNNNNCSLENGTPQLNSEKYYYLSWIRFDVRFVTSDNRETWKNSLKDVIYAFGNQLSETDHFINDTISIYYCQLESPDATLEPSQNQNVNNLDNFSITFTICVVSFFIIIAICGRIDAKFIRKNEIFSIGSIISATTYTADIVSGVEILI